MSVLLLIGTQLFLGCEKKPIIVPPVVLQPTVELTITPTGTLKYGDNCTVSWTSTNANGGVLLNNQSVGISGTITKKLFRDTTFILRGVNGSLTTTNQKSVTVGDWTTSDVGLLTHNYWNLKRIEFYEDNNFTDSLILVQTPERLTHKYYYRLKGTFNSVMYDYNTSGVGVCESIDANGNLVGNGTWSISGKVLTLGVVKYDIVELSTTRFSIMRFLEILTNGKSKYVKETYVRK